MSQRLLCSLGFFCLALSMATIGAQAQYGSLPLGTLAVSGSTPCPGSGWYNYQGTYVACYVAAITNCAGASPLGVTFGYLDPVGYVKGVLVEKGVIVLHTGQGGTSPAGDDVGVPDGDFSFANYYFLQGYVGCAVSLGFRLGGHARPLPVDQPAHVWQRSAGGVSPRDVLQLCFQQHLCPDLRHELLSRDVRARVQRRLSRTCL